MDRSHPGASLGGVIRRIALLGLLAAAVAGCGEERSVAPAIAYAEAIPPWVSDPEWRRVIDDWYDNGQFDRPHTCRAVRETGERIPARGPNYSSIHGDLRAYADLVCPDTPQRGTRVELRHRYVHRLPYPAGPRYSVSFRAVGDPRGVRWVHFASDPRYVRAGNSAEARFTTVLLPPGRYVVASWTNLCTDPNDGCRTLSGPQSRCARRVEVSRGRAAEIEVVARGSSPCTVAVRRARESRP
jgi:hypothetical protein